MSYVVLARKWRPQSFDDLVGQEHVSRTLESAIAAGRVAHAFLFTGVRGVGKTTSARILAKALNCEKGPTARPCQSCPQCVEITAGSDVDVQEIDGASYNGVDEVRRLQESLPYRPARDRFKIFIVDEVHMLSTAAWNAFLKTLEEPPPHVKFIFATTEVHKVPITILSRCQRYDFKLIPTRTIAARLRHVLDREGVPADDAALAVLAREAAGSMRDAMSLLDQAIAWVGEGERLTAEGVARVLGVAAHTVLHRICAALVDGDAATCLSTVEELARQGYDIPHVTRDLLALLRDLVVAKVCSEPASLLDRADEEVRDVQALAARADADDLLRLQLGLSKAFDDIVKSGQPRAALEMTLVRLARRPPLVPIDDLLRRLAELERRLAGGGAAPPAGSRPDPGARPTPAAAPPAPRRAEAVRFDAGATEPRAQAPSPIASASVAVEPRRGAPPAQRPSSPTDAARPPAPARAESSPRPRPARDDPSPIPPSRGDSSAPASRAPSSRAPSAGATPPVAQAVAPPEVDGAATSVPPTSVPRATLDAWRAVLEIVRARRPALASILEHAVVLRFGPDEVVLGYEPGSFLATHALDPAARALLAEALREHFGSPVEPTFDLAIGRNAGATLAQLDAADRKARMEAARRAVVDHPLVAAAVELLGAELKEVRLAGELSS